MGFFSRLFRAESNTSKDTTPSAQNSSEFSDDNDLSFDPKTAATVLAEIDIDIAIAAHENWKVRLQNYLDGKSTEDLNVEVVCRDDKCDLGKWLHGPGGQRLGKYPAFSVLVARHKYFHVQASTIVALGQGGDKETAYRALNSSYIHASNQVVILLKSLKRGLAR